MDTELRQRMVRELSRNGYRVAGPDVRNRHEIYQVIKNGEKYLMYIQVRNFKNTSEGSTSRITLPGLKTLKGIAEDKKMLYAFIANHQIEKKSLSKGMYFFLFDIADIGALPKTEKRYRLVVKELEDISNKLEKEGKITFYLYCKGDVGGGFAGSRGQKSNQEKRLSPEERKAIEENAVEKVREYYRGYEVTSVEYEYVGWDLDVRRGEESLCVEVKGHRGDKPSFELTPNEYEKMQEHADNYRVGVVCNALTEPTLTIWRPEKCQTTGKWFLSKIDGSGEIEKIGLEERVAARVRLIE